MPIAVVSKKTCRRLPRLARVFVTFGGENGYDVKWCYRDETTISCVP